MLNSSGGGSRGYVLHVVCLRSCVAGKEMNDKLRAAAKAALLALKCLDGLECAREEIEALEAALVEPSQEPMLEINPEKRGWVGLTDEEILRLYKEHAKYQEEGMKLSGWNTFAADVQAKLRDKNT